MKDRLTKLLTVKSLITLMLTVVVCYLAIVDRMNIEQIYLMIIAFYFGTQVEKNNKGE